MCNILMTKRGKNNSILSLPITRQENPAAITIPNELETVFNLTTGGEVTW